MKRMNNDSINDTMTFLRQNFWIPSMRQRVKSVLRTSVVCLKLQGCPFRVPPAPPLPSIQVQEAHPFEVISIHYTGAHYVKY